MGNNREKSNIAIAKLDKKIKVNQFHFRRLY